MAVGSLWYCYFRHDFEMTTAFKMFEERKFERLIKKEKFDD